MSESGQSNLIINYLPQTLTDSEFESMFLSIGALKSNKIVRDKLTGYSYGYGFVEYTRRDDAIKAIQTLNGLQLQNKKIKVAFSRTGDNIKGSNLYIRSVPLSMSKDELEALFSTHGTIIQTRLLTEPNTGKSKGIGFVLFDKKDEATSALKALDGTVPDGATEPLKVKFTQEHGGRPPPVAFLNGRGGGGGGNRPVTNGNLIVASGYGRPAQPGYASGLGPMRQGQASGFGPMRHENRLARYIPMQRTHAPQVTSAAAAGFILFVYNIGPTTDEKQLWQLFAPFGHILKVNVIRDFVKAQGKGYGFVTMASYHDANLAVQALNGYNFAGKALQVSFKNPKS